MPPDPTEQRRVPRRSFRTYALADGIDNGGTERGTLTNNYDVTVTIEH